MFEMQDALTVLPAEAPIPSGLILTQPVHFVANAVLLRTVGSVHCARFQREGQRLQCGSGGINRAQSRMPLCKDWQWEALLRN